MIPDWVKFKVFPFEIHENVTFIPFEDKETVIGERVKIDSGAVIYGGVEIDNDTIIGHHTVIRPNSRIGYHTLITNHCNISGSLEIGNHVRINQLCQICQKSKIEDYVFIGQGFLSGNDNIPYYRRGHRPMGQNLDRMYGPTIKYGARIGLGVRVLPAVTIGRQALIGAGAVVTKDIPDFAIAYGIPAKVVRYINPHLDRIIECKINHRG